MTEITLTHRQALICERMMEIIELKPRAFYELVIDVLDFSGERLSDEEWQQLGETLRGD